MEDIHLHPMLVHFPIALLLTALAFEILGLLLKKKMWQDAAVLLYGAAALALPLVVRTGLNELHEHNLHHPVAELHEELGLATMWTVLASLPALWAIHIKRRPWFAAVFVVLLLTASILVGLTAYNGGRLVYEYGVGVSQ